MLPDRVSNPGPLTYESGALPIALRGPATLISESDIYTCVIHYLHTHTKKIFWYILYNKIIHLENSKHPKDSPRPCF